MILSHLLQAGAILQPQEPDAVLRALGALIAGLQGWFEWLSRQRSRENRAAIRDLTVRLGEFDVKIDEVRQAVLDRLDLMVTRIHDHELLDEKRFGELHGQLDRLDGERRTEQRLHSGYDRRDSA